jgi:tetratricopeptide (TPR) repeat protein
LRKAAVAKPDNAVIYTYLGICLSSQAANCEDNAKGKEFYKQAIEAFDKAKELDPDKHQANWGYNRYQAYYGLYGEDDPRTKAAEQDR